MTTALNIPLLRKAVEFVEQSAAKYGSDPIETAYDTEGTGTVWFQGDWSALVNEDVAVNSLKANQPVNLEACGTAYCVAGYVTSLQPGYHAEVRLSMDNEPRLYETLDGSPHFRHSDVAREALGLTPSQAEILFAGGNTAQEVRSIAEAFAGEKL